jgi:hypothetical protein
MRGGRWGRSGRNPLCNVAADGGEIAMVAVAERRRFGFSQRARGDETTDIGALLLGDGRDAGQRLAVDARWVADDEDLGMARQGKIAALNTSGVGDSVPYLVSSDEGPLWACDSTKFELSRALRAKIISHSSCSLVAISASAAAWAR